MGIYNNYQEYLMSDMWLDKKHELIMKIRHCHYCGLSMNKWILKKVIIIKKGKAEEKYKMLPEITESQLTVHHLTYEHVENEPEKDLMVVCNNCHNKIHETQTSALSTSNEGMELPLNPISSQINNRNKGSETKPLNEGI